MKKNKIVSMFLAVFVTLGFLTVSLNADTAVKNKSNTDNKKGEQTLSHTYNFNSIFDNQKNTVSNFEFFTSNYGIFGQDIANNTGGGYWPKGSLNQYIFAGGFWFGAQKKRPGTDVMKNYVLITYDPNDGSSWMVPGEIEEGKETEIDESVDAAKKYRTYFSTDFRPADGIPFDESQGPNWPIWDTDPDYTIKKERYFGHYITNSDNRNLSVYKKGPAFISGEDIFAVYKDTDLRKYKAGAAQAKMLGYPLGLEFQQIIYSWGFGDYRDFIFIKFDIINKLKDTLLNCYIAPVMDVDIAYGTNSSAGATNDRVRYYEEDTTLNLAVQWTDVNYNSAGSLEKGKGFGYLGFDFLESPSIKVCESIDSLPDGSGGFDYYCSMCIKHGDSIAYHEDTEYDTTWIDPDDHSQGWTKIDTTIKNWTEIIEVCDKKMLFDMNEENFMRKDARYYDNRYQLGMRTFRNWKIEDDKNTDEERYSFMSSGLRDGDDGAADKRFLMATGPFHFRPKDTVRVVVGIILANCATQPEADGSTADLALLVSKDKFAQAVYDNNFVAPTPPDVCNTKWAPLNNAVIVRWDSLSELSNDIYEKGLDFMGYRIYRARRADLDTFNVDQISGNASSPNGKGPLGWKQVASYEIPTPFVKSYMKTGNMTTSPYIDSMYVVGPARYDNTNQIDSMAIAMMKVGKGVVSYWSHWSNSLPNAYKLVLYPCDTGILTKPWGPYYSKLMGDVDSMYYDWANLDNPMNQNPLFKVLVGKVILDTNNCVINGIRFNPLYWEHENIILRNVTSLAQIINNDNLVPLVEYDNQGQLKYLYLKDRVDSINDNGTKRYTIERLFKISLEEAMNSPLHLLNVKDSVFKYVSNDNIDRFDWFDFESDLQTKANVIMPYMEEITNNRTFIDNGDDNHDGKIIFSDDPLNTEKLINNIDYYYKVLAYDEGDFTQQTPGKLNSGGEGMKNTVKAFPRAAAVGGDEVEFEVISITDDLIGGLYNFKMVGIDKQRCMQLLAGDTLELEFQPYVTQDDLDFPLYENRTNKRHRSFGLYARNMTLKNISKNNEIIYSGRTFLENTPCSIPYKTSFSEDAASYMLADTVIIDSLSSDVPDLMKRDSTGLSFNKNKIYRYGSFTTGNFTESGYCYALPFAQNYSGILSFSFDYLVEQRGGRFRPDTIIKPDYVNTICLTINQDNEITFSPANPSYTSIKKNESCVMLSQWVGYEEIGLGYINHIYGQYNNGPGDYKLTFKEGGQETIPFIWDISGNKNQKEFTVNYLTMEIEDITELNYEMPDHSIRSIKYPIKILPMELPDSVNMSFPTSGYFINQRYYPDPRNLVEKSTEFINHYNMTSYASVNSRGVSKLNLHKCKAWDLNKTPLSLLNSYPPEDIRLKTSVGTQNRYYLSGYSTTGTPADVVDFVNVLNLNGCNFVFDYANYGRRFFKTENNTDWYWFQKPVAEYTYGQDFSAGDVVYLKTTGGAYGFPAPGAKVRFLVKAKSNKEENLTDKQMEKIKIVPNPYYVSHQGQRSPYDAKIYFTRLPKECTINIYTATGDLVLSINHDETSADVEKEAIEIWNLLSKNGQRVQSQTFVAHIKAKNGAETIQNFSLVVGGTRFITE
jgi:hypothetical protein